MINYEDIAETAKRYQLDPNLLFRQIMAESGGNAKAVSSAGAQGLMQLMPATAKTLGVKDPFDARESLDAGARLMRENLDRNNGRVDLALAEYHGGPNRAKWGPKTADYVGKILGGYTGKGTTNHFDQFDQKREPVELFADEETPFYRSRPPPPEMTGGSQSPYTALADAGLNIMRTGRLPTPEDIS